MYSRLYRAYQAAFSDFAAYLDGELIDKMMELNVSNTEDGITQNIFDRVAPFALVDRYQAYQMLNDQWGEISTDLEILQTEGFEAAKQVDPNWYSRRKATRKRKCRMAGSAM